MHLGLTITQDPEMNIPGGKAFRSTPKKKKVSRKQLKDDLGCSDCLVQCRNLASFIKDYLKL